MSTQDRGRFVWHELNTTDTAAGERFYRAITAWGMLPFPANPSYRMWTADGVPQGGLMQLPDEAKRMGAPPHWLSYIGVPDVDASVRQAVALGARTFVSPQDIPGAGRFAVLADPQGAVFAVHSSAQPMSKEAASKVGEFSWHELATTNWQAAWKFYEQLFGWRKTSAMDMGPAGTYQMFGRDGFTYGGMCDKPKEMQGPPHWLPYVMVPSIDRALAKITGAGGRILTGPMDVPGGDRVVTCMDPQGAAFALHSKGAAPKARRKAKAQSKTKPKAKPVAKAKVKPKRRPEPKAKSAARAAARPKAKAKPKSKPKPRVKAKSKKATGKAKR